MTKEELINALSILDTKELNEVLDAISRPNKGIKMYRAKPYLNGSKTTANMYVQGYYIEHETRMLSPLGDELKDDEIKHYIAFSDFADWNMPRSLRIVEIDFSTLEEVK